MNIKKNCLKCNTSFFKKDNEGTRYWAKRRYCSATCSAIHRRVGYYIRSPEHRKKMSVSLLKNKKHCLNGSIRFKELNRLKKGKQLEEIYGKERATEIRKSLIKYGDKNNNWIDGRSYYPYAPNFNRLLKKKVKDRDGWVCINCDISDSFERKKDPLGRGLTIHHIDYDKFNNEINNLVTVCRSCNSKANKNREKWIKKYKSYLLGA